MTLKKNHQMNFFWSTESRNEKLHHTEALLTDAIEILDYTLSDLRETSSTEGHLIDCFFD